MPVAWKGTAQQCAGRLHREHASKTGVRVLDYVDGGHPVLLHMWEKRPARLPRDGLPDAHARNNASLSSPEIGQPIRFPYRFRLFGAVFGRSHSIIGHYPM
ncbi:hypothetical protein [Burkholderia mayonis]|uniref:hypothetical protein n=1 Tax=Burkholderia mayonis TaxID=1385591 RepID=UPI000A4AC66C